MGITCHKGAAAFIFFHFHFEVLVGGGTLCITKLTLASLAAVPASTGSLSNYSSLFLIFFHYICG
jgi:hypothetical protein